METSESKHGREETHPYIQFAVPETLIGREQWEVLKSIGIAIRTRIQDGIKSLDRRYYLLSFKPNVKQFASLAKNHWSIENTLH